MFPSMGNLVLTQYDPNFVNQAAVPISQAELNNANLPIMVDGRIVNNQNNGKNDSINNNNVQDDDYHAKMEREQQQALADISNGISPRNNGNDSNNANNAFNSTLTKPVQSLNTESLALLQRGVPVYVHEAASFATADNLSAPRMVLSTLVLENNGLKIVPGSAKEFMTWRNLKKKMGADMVEYGVNLDVKLVEQMELDENCDFFYELPPHVRCLQSDNNTATESEEIAKCCLCIWMCPGARANIAADAFRRLDLKKDGTAVAKNPEETGENASASSDSGSLDDGKGGKNKNLPVIPWKQDDSGRVLINLRFLSPRLRDWAVQAVRHYNPKVLVMENTFY